MYRTQNHRSLRLAILAAGLGASFSDAAILVGLDPTLAAYDSDKKGIANDGGTAGSQSGITALGDLEHLNGLTFNIAFTPTATDLDRATPADARSVLLVEIGGTSNGFGLYLIDGVPTVLTKQGSNDATIPASLNDTSLPAVAVQSPIGKLNPGTGYSFSASWNHLGTLELKVQPNGASLPVVSSHAISGTPGNWSGNDTISVKTISTANAGGLAGNNAGNVLGPPFDVHNAFSFAGSVSRALFWNASSVTPPVATAPVVLGFEATSLPSTGKVRLHWRVTEGGAPAATSIVIKSGETIIHTPSSLENFADVDASGATSFTLSAANVTGTTSGSASVAADTAFSTEVRADAPVAWFRFNDQTGSQLIADSAENAAPHNGRIFGQPVSGSTGFVDGSALFDGGSGIISNAILDPGNLTSGFTVEAVVRRAPGVIGANPVILAQRGSTGRLFLTSPADGKLLSDVGAGEAKHSDGKLHDNQWAHIAVVVDRLHTEIRWYIDGQLAGSSADGRNPDGSTFNSNFTLESATGEWIIGLGKALAGNHWKGHIDELVVYDRVLDDPNGDADRLDSRIPSHRNAWWSETTGLLDFSASKTSVNEGDPVELIAKVGADITSVTIDGVGSVPIDNGTATITVNPNATTTYQVTATGPGGSTTSTVSVTALRYLAPIVKGFAVTKLGTPGQVRLHWKVTEGEAVNPTTIVIKAGATELHAPLTLQGYADVDAGSATAFTLSAENNTGTTDANTALDAENSFSAAVREDAPVAWYRFNEPVGTELFVDSADNGVPHNGRPSGTPVSGVAGVVDGAISLDANGGVITDLILNPGQLDPGFTIESVVRRDAALNTANRAIVSQSDLNGTGRVLLSVSDATGTPRTYLGQGVRKDADVNLAAETWAHLVVVVDALNTEVRWYLDGELIGSSKDGANPDGSSFDPNFIFEASEGAWNIGLQKTLTADLWRGEIDDVVIYNSLLDDPDADGNKSDSRIAAHRAAWWSQTSGVIQLSTAAASINAGGSTDLTIKVGPDITSVSVDHGIDSVTLTNGNAVIPLNPLVTTTYTITFTGPGGTFTQTVTVNVVQPPAIAPAIVSSSVQGGNFVLNFTGAPSTTYAVRGSTTLGNFNEILDNVTTDGSGAGTATIPVSPGTTAARFFRIEDLP